MKSVVAQTDRGHRRLLVGAHPTEPAPLRKLQPPRGCRQDLRRFPSPRPPRPPSAVAEASVPRPVIVVADGVYPFMTRSTFRTLINRPAGDFARANWLGTAMPSCPPR